MCDEAHQLPLTKKFLHFFEKATAPTAPVCPSPIPMQPLLSASHTLTYIGKLHYKFSNKQD